MELRILQSVAVVVVECAGQCFGVWKMLVEVVGSRMAGVLPGEMERVGVPVEGRDPAM